MIVIESLGSFSTYIYNCIHQSKGFVVLYMSNEFSFKGISLPIYNKHHELSF